MYSYYKNIKTDVLIEKIYEKINILIKWMIHETTNKLLFLINSKDVDLHSLSTKKVGYFLEKVNKCS